MHNRNEVPDDERKIVRAAEAPNEFGVSEASIATATTKPGNAYKLHIFASECIQGTNCNARESLALK